MTVLEFEILECMALHSYPQTPSWIADDMRGGNEAWPFEVRSVQGCLGRMEKKKWVKRKFPSPFSRRSIGWYITDEGREALAEAKV